MINGIYVKAAKTQHKTHLTLFLNISPSENTNLYKI